MALKAKYSMYFMGFERLYDSVKMIVKGFVKPFDYLKLKMVSNT